MKNRDETVFQQWSYGWLLNFNLRFNFLHKFALISSPQLHLQQFKMWIYTTSKEKT